MELKKAVSQDIPQLVEFRIAYLKEDFGTLSIQDQTKIFESLPTYFSEHLNKDLYVYTISEQGIIFATAFLLIIEKPANPSFMNGRIGEVLNMFTRVAQRNRGYANQLMKCLLKDAGKLKLDYVELKASKMGEPIYKKLGFYVDEPNHVPMKFIIE